MQLNILLFYILGEADEEFPIDAKTDYKSQLDEIFMGGSVQRTPAQDATLSLYY
jgi:hypothetical protein